MRVGVDQPIRVLLPAAGETPLNLELMRLIDAQFLETPWYGSRQMARHLWQEGYVVGRKRVRRLMAKMGLAPIYRRPLPHPEHRVYPYLLRGLAIERPSGLTTTRTELIQAAKLSRRTGPPYGIAFPCRGNPWLTSEMLS